MFKNVNSCIPKEHIDFNVLNALRILGLSGINYEIVGNKNKDFVGDLDVAIEQKAIEQKWSLDSDGQFWEQVNARLKQFKNKSMPPQTIIDFKINKGLSQFHISLPLYPDGNNKCPIPSYDYQGKREHVHGIIQIDFFIGNLEWMSKIVSGAPEISQYKAVYRNLLLGAIFSAVKFKSTKNKDIFYKFSLNTRVGLKMTCKQSFANKKKLLKISEKIISTDPNVIPKILFKKNKYSWIDIDSYEKLWFLINKEEFRYKNHLTNIVEDFNTACKEFKLELPIEHR